MKQIAETQVVSWVFLIFFAVVLTTNANIGYLNEVWCLSEVKIKRGQIVQCLLQYL